PPTAAPSGRPRPRGSASSPSASAPTTRSPSTRSGRRAQQPSREESPETSSTGTSVPLKEGESGGTMGSPALSPPCRCLRPVANLDEPGGCRAGRLVSRLAAPDSGSLALAVGSTLDGGATNRV